MKLLVIALAWLVAAVVCLLLYGSGLEFYHRYESPRGTHVDKAEFVGESLPGPSGGDWRYAGEVAVFEHHPERRALAGIGVVTAALLFSVRVATRRPR